MVTLPSPLAGEGSGVRGRCRRRKDWRPSVLFLCKLLCKSLTPPHPPPPPPPPPRGGGGKTSPPPPRPFQQNPGKGGKGGKGAKGARPPPLSPFCDPHPPIVPP